MTWFKIDDGLPQHPKVLRIPRDRRLAAVGLWSLAGAWCAKNLTDGVLPDYMVGELGGTEAEVKDLVELAELWEIGEGGFILHDYLEYNPSKEQVKAERAASAERQRRARERSAEKRAAEQAARDAEQDAQALRESSRRESRRDGGRESRQTSRPQSRSSEGVSHGPPDPTRPDPTPTTAPTEPSGDSAPDADGPINLRAQGIARGYTDVVKLSNFPAVFKIVKKALQAGDYDDQDVRDAMARLAADRRAVTTETLRTELEGLAPARQGPAKATQRFQTALENAADFGASLAQQRGEVGA